MTDFWKELNIVYSELLFLFELQRNENIRANTDAAATQSEHSGGGDRKTLQSNLSQRRGETWNLLPTPRTPALSSDEDQAPPPPQRHGSQQSCRTSDSTEVTTDTSFISADQDQTRAPPPTGP